MKRSSTDDNGAVWHFPRLLKLRQDAAVTITDLANRAHVSRDLIGSLEQGKAHTRLKVMAVFNELNQDKKYAGSLKDSQEVVRLGLRKSR